jgi:SOS-response transcriptional repressor LexA
MKANVGRPPTAREIQVGTGLRSLSVVHQSLGELERDGLIRRGEFGKTRGIRIIGATYRLPEEEAETI